MLNVVLSGYFLVPVPQPTLQNPTSVGESDSVFLHLAVLFHSTLVKGRSVSFFSVCNHIFLRNSMVLVDTNASFEV